MRFSSGKLFMTGQAFLLKPHMYFIKIPPDTADFIKSKAFYLSVARQKPGKGKGKPSSCYPV